MCYEDADVVAFLDIQPVNAGHLLVVPRSHHESLLDVPHALAMHLFEVAMELAPVVKQVARADGLNIVVPYNDDNYHRARPSLRMRAPNDGPIADRVLDLDGHFATEAHYRD